MCTKITSGTKETYSLNTEYNDKTTLLVRLKCQKLQILRTSKFSKKTSTLCSQK